MSVFSEHMFADGLDVLFETHEERASFTDLDNVTTDEIAVLVGPASTDRVDDRIIRLREFVARAADVPNVAVGTKWTFDGQPWSVAEFQKDAGFIHFETTRDERPTPGRNQPGRSRFR